MIMRAIDSAHDWQFGKGKENYVAGPSAIAENIQTRLLSFLNNCYFDMNAGIDWFTYLGVPNKSQEIVLRARAIILQSYGVVSVNSISINAPHDTRNAVLTYTISTIYSQNYTENLEVINYA